MLDIISLIIFLVRHQLSVWQVAVSLQYFTAGMERTSQEQVNRKKVGPLKRTPKKRGQQDFVENTLEISWRCVE